MTLAFAKIFKPASYNNFEREKSRIFFALVSVFCFLGVDNRIRFLRWPSVTENLSASPAEGTVGCRTQRASRNPRVLGSSVEMAVRGGGGSEEVIGWGWEEGGNAVGSDPSLNPCSASLSPFRPVRLSLWFGVLGPLLLAGPRFSRTGPGPTYIGGVTPREEGATRQGGQRLGGGGRPTACEGVTGGPPAIHFEPLRVVYHRGGRDRGARPPGSESGGVGLSSGLRLSEMSALQRSRRTPP